MLNKTTEFFFTKPCFIRKHTKKSHSISDKIQNTDQNKYWGTFLSGTTNGWRKGLLSWCWLWVWITSPAQMSSLWSEVIDHAVAFQTVEEEEVAVWSVSLGESLRTNTRVRHYFISSFLLAPPFRKCVNHHIYHICANTPSQADYLMAPLFLSSRNRNQEAKTRHLCRRL